MRLSTALFLLLLVSGESFAHVPDGDQTLIESLHHSFFSAHHLPITALVFLLLVVLAPICIKRVKSALRKR